MSEMADSVQRIEEIERRCNAKDFEESLVIMELGEVGIADYLIAIPRLHLY